MNESDEEIVLAFLEESRENLDQLDRDLVELERNPADPQLLGQIFRTIHTIKGTCGFLGFHRLEALSHAGENLLGALRIGELRLDADMTSSLLSLVDAIRLILDLIDQTGTEGDDDHAGVVAALDRHLTTASTIETRSTDAAAQPADREVAASTETSIRVDVAILDKLMNLVGELVLARTQFGESPATSEAGPLASPYRQLRLVTSELQECVMRLRLQPVGTITGKFRRVVRDLAAELGKQITITIEGEDVGVDKAVNEALRDPLLHLVRNAVDHGIELPADRRAAGKPAHGTVTLRAFHQGGRVHIELADDGRGIDSDRLVARAIAAGMLGAEDAAALSPHDALDLILRPGLSTKERVTNISGRGVGMDVVRTALEQVGGSIDVATEVGRGSVFRLNVPLTLAIMPVLIASVGAQRFAVPQVDVQEVVYIAPDETTTMVHDLDGALVCRLRDELLPLVDLASLLRLDSNRRADGLVVVVVHTSGRRFGIVVDEIGDTLDVVVKPLTRATRTIRCFGGVTILGDGQPVLILDMPGVAVGAGITVARDDTASRVVEPVHDATTTDSILLAYDAAGSRVAVEMSTVRRLEQISPASVERAGPAEVVQYRGGILPLVRLADLLESSGPAVSQDGVLHTVVCETSIGLVGIVVGHIDDVVPRPATPAAHQPPSRRGVIESLIVDNRIAELLDVELLVADSGVGSRG